MFKLKECCLRLESVGTVPKIKMQCRFTEFGHRSLFLSLCREAGSSDPREERVTKENLPGKSIKGLLNFMGVRIRSIYVDQRYPKRERRIEKEGRTVLGPYLLTGEVSNVEERVIDIRF